MITVALVMLSLAAIGFLVRIVLGPTLADRVVALDGLIVILAGAIAADAARTGRTLFLDTMVVAALVGFVGTAAVARFIERRG